MYQPSTIKRSLRAHSRVRGPLLLGPAFVAGIAYVDPGNVATNVAAGSRYGYLLIWVVVASSLVAMLAQYLSAKLGIATGKSLPVLCRERFSRRASWALWLQAEAVALATDLAEVLGGALALDLLFDLPLLVGGIITGVASLGLLFLQSHHGQPGFERVTILLLVVVAMGFGWSAVTAQPDLSGAVHGVVPRFDGSGSILVAAGILGATVMPHAIYLHSALIRDRFGARAVDSRRRQALLRATRTDVLLAMAVAGSVNLAMLLAAAGALHGHHIDSVIGAYGALRQSLGPLAALLFAVGLLASGVASSSVGTYAGAVILDGFLGRRLWLPLRRLITLAPAVGVRAMGVGPAQALLLSQVVLSFGIPFALWPLVLLSRDRAVMGDLANRPLTTSAAAAAATVVSGLSVVLIALTLQPLI